MTGRPLRAAVIGMGGFARHHHEALWALEREGACRVVCTCDPDMGAFGAERAAWEFACRGVRTFPDYREMLAACAGGLDLVTVPTPVPLHAPMHRACVEHGLACYLEKPPTLTFDELDGMLAVEAGAARQTQVGFNFIVEPERRALKARLLAGEFGAARRVCFGGLWPRPASYFTRAPWAGRLMLDGRLVLDSCLGNAMAHYLHNVHFWCGRGAVLSWAEAITVRAELYRAHAIEGADTVFARGVCDGGTEIRVAATHACASPHRQWERVECDRATLTYVTGGAYQIAWEDGRREEGPTAGGVLLRENFLAYFDYLCGDAPRPLTRLADTRPFVHFNDLLYVAARRITTVSDADTHRSSGDDGLYVAIDGIADVCDTFLTTGRFPSEQGAAWACPGGEASRADLPLLAGAVRRMAWPGPETPSETHP